MRLLAITILSTAALSFAHLYSYLPGWGRHVVGLAFGLSVALAAAQVVGWVKEKDKDKP